MLAEPLRNTEGGIPVQRQAQQKWRG